MDTIHSSSRNPWECPEAIKVKYRLGQTVHTWHMNTHTDRHTHTCMHEHGHRSALGTYTCTHAISYTTHCYDTYWHVTNWHDQDWCNTDIRHWHITIIDSLTYWSPQCLTYIYDNVITDGKVKCKVLWAILKLGYCTTLELTLTCLHHRQTDTEFWLTCNIT